MDLKKVFDCVKTDGSLQNKIKYFCQNNKISNWADSYFKYRQQFTNWGLSNSEKVFNHPISIIQGSKSGPFWYNLFVNDLPKVTTLLSVLFADDANFLCSNKNPELLCKQVNEEMAKIIDYFNSNGLSVSIEKTTYMIFTPKNKKKLKWILRLAMILSLKVKKLLFWVFLLIINSTSPPTSKKYIVKLKEVSMV